MQKRTGVWVRGTLVAWALAGPLSFAGCNDDGSLAQSQGRLVIEPTDVDFGRVFVGETRTARLQMRSEGLSSVPFEARFGFGFGEGLVVAPQGGTLPPRSSLPLQLEFSPMEPGERSVQVLYATATGTVAVRIQARVERPLDCEDGNPCTLNRFDREAGRCVTEVVTDACDDLNACTQNDACAQAMCLGESRSCDDNNVCTDDFCDRDSGCVNVLARECDDGNPCTEDLCDPVRGCLHRDVPDLTPCNDGVPCLSGSVCRSGRCEEFFVQDGAPCDDGNPCSTAERCTDGLCLDPDVPLPVDGALKWEATVGTTAPGASRSPLFDVDGTLFVGVTSGVVALDQCGQIRWENRSLGPPILADQMIVLPRGLAVARGATLFLIDRLSGDVLHSLDTREVHRVDTSTADRMQILSMAARTSGVLLVSGFLDRARGEDEGLLLEVDRDFRAATLFARLGPQHGAQVALDADEAVVAVLRPGPPDDPASQQERLLRFGQPDLPDTRWTTDLAASRDSQVAIDGAGRVWWTGGLWSVTRNGIPRLLRPPDVDFALGSGGVVVDRDRVYLVEPGPESADLVGYSVTSTAPVFRLSLQAPAPGSTPAVDQAGNLFVANQDGTLFSFGRNGTLRYRRELDTRLEAPSVVIGPGENLVVVDGSRVFAIQSDLPLAPTAWPRYRRDNFGTAHR